jgi:Peptidase S46
MKKPFLSILFLTLVSTMLQTNSLSADEGLWLFNNPPAAQLKKKYGFEPTAAWLEHVQKSSVRFRHGSGSFVSADGLVMTNHHVGAEALQKLSSPEKDYLKDGFYAKTLAEEFKSVNEEILVLMEIADVTTEVKAAVKPDMTAEQAFIARRGVMARIEADSEKKTGFHSEVVTLYQGGLYHLYRYKRYTDVRLVFAPEQQIAFYGGDPANFAYPRYDLDMCFFRVYEDGKPVKVKHYLKWSKSGVQDDELVFVSGHPGHTDRLNTVADLEYNRDVRYPMALQSLNRREVMLSIYSMRGDEYERKAKEDLFSVANSRKAYYYGLAGLQDAAIMATKVAQEKKLREGVAKNPALKHLAGAWDTIAEIQKIRAANAKRYNLLERGQGFNSTLFGFARTLVRAAAELPKPNEKRLREFGDAGLKTLKNDLFSEEPLYPDYEMATLSDSLGWLCEQLGYQDPLVQKVLAGKTPQARAYQLVHDTKLFDVKSRQRLFDGGQKAIDEVKDPMIRLAEQVDADARDVRKILENKYQEPSVQAYDKIAQAKFAVEGTNTYPDATFTLRLSFGQVKGYVEDGQKIPYQTTFRGLYELAKVQKDRPPFDLPKRWIDRKGKLNLDTSFNFVCTADIIGGNSGSPVVNRNGEVVGLIFDGNIQSLVWDFVYTDEQARAVAVSSPAIPEALTAIYDAGPLGHELVSGLRQ